MNSSNESISAMRTRGIDPIPVCDTCAGLLEAVLGVLSRIPKDAQEEHPRCALCGRPATAQATSRRIMPTAVPRPGEVEVTVLEQIVRLSIFGDIEAETVESVVDALSAARTSGNAVLIDLLGVRAQSARSTRELVERLVDEPGGPTGLVVRLGQLPGRAHARALASGWLVTDCYEEAERELVRMAAETEFTAPGD